MSVKANYDRLMREEIARIDPENDGRYPRLLLHACCAPCSSACLERLWQSFDITVFYFNPNIDNNDEYRMRLSEESRLIHEFNSRLESGDYDTLIPDKDGSKPRRICLVKGDYTPYSFHEAARGLENEPEGGTRCTACYELRLRESARFAAENKYDFFTTTLTISPLKDADRLNEIGERAGREYGVSFLPSDFKKRDGYRRSIELSREFGLYRQNYCGCSFSKNVV